MSVRKQIAVQPICPSRILRNIGNEIISEAAAVLYHIGKALGGADSERDEKRDNFVRRIALGDCHLDLRAHTLFRGQCIPQLIIAHGSVQLEFSRKIILIPRTHISIETINERKPNESVFPED